MSKVTDAVEAARSDAQALHKKFLGTTAKDHAAIRTGARSVAAQASELGVAVRGLVDSQRADAKQHLKDAASSLQAAATNAQDLAHANDADLKAQSIVALGRIRTATQQLSQAVAAKRASLVKS